MLNGMFLRRSAWLSPAAFVCLLLLAYGVVAESLNSRGQSVSLTVPNLTSTTQTVDVPTNVVQSIAGSLFRVHNIDELVVLPAQAGPGYDVYATVNLGYNTLETESIWGNDVRKQVDDFFRGVYASGQGIQDAEVYFLLGDQTVAGAGLGKDAYASLADVVDTNPGSFVQALQGAPADAAPGPADKWFYTTGSSPFH